MLAGQLVSPGRFEVRTLPDPATPLPSGGALLRVDLAGVCGSDIHLFRHGRIGELVGKLPMTIGHEAMGTVLDVAHDAPRSLVGQRVAIEPTLNCGHCHCCLSGNPNLCTEYQFVGLPPHPGVMQQQLVHPVRLLEPIPDRMTDEQAVMLEPLAVAVWAVDLGHVKPGQPAAVLGAGVLGGLTVLLLKQLGCFPLIVTDRLDYRLDLARELGASHVVNAARQDAADAILDLTHRRGVDVAFEAAGDESTADQLVRITAPAGRCVVIGITDSDRFAFTHGIARRKGLTISMVRRSRRTLPRSIDLVAREGLPVEKLVTHRYPLADIQRAFDTVSNYSDRVVKAMVRPQ